MLDINLTAMIDVIFMLIMFFLATAQIAKMTRADLDLPLEPGEQEREATEDGFVINLLADGSLVVSDRTVGFDELRLIVREELDRQRGARTERTRVLIRPDRNANAEALNRVVTMLRELGVGMARIATEPP